MSFLEEYQKQNPRQQKSGDDGQSEFVKGYHKWKQEGGGQSDDAEQSDFLRGYHKWKQENGGGQSGAVSPFVQGYYAAKSGKSLDQQTPLIEQASNPQTTANTENRTVLGRLGEDFKQPFVDAHAAAKKAITAISGAGSTPPSASSGGESGTSNIDDKEDPANVQLSTLGGALSSLSQDPDMGQFIIWSNYDEDSLFVQPAEKTKILDYLKPENEQLLETLDEVSGFSDPTVSSIMEYTDGVYERVRKEAEIVKEAVEKQTNRNGGILYPDYVDTSGYSEQQMKEYDLWKQWFNQTYLLFPHDYYYHIPSGNLSNHMGRIVGSTTKHGNIRIDGKTIATITKEGKIEFKSDFYNPDEQDEDPTWFKSGSFADGFSLLDLPAAALGTLGDVGLGLVKGAGEGLENAAKGMMVMSAAGGPKGTFLAKQADKNRNNVIRNGNIINTEDLSPEWIEDNSMFGEKMDAVVQSGGQQLTQVGLQALGIPWWMTAAATSFGGEATAAYQSGATAEQAVTSGLISAGAEIITEKLFGSFKYQGKALSDTLTTAISRGIANKTLRALTSYSMDVVMEGGEEILSGVLSAVGQKLTYAKEEELNELFSSEEAWDSFVGGALISGVGNFRRFSNALTKNGVDYNTGLTDSERKKADEISAQAVEQLEQRGESINFFKKNALYDDAVELVKSRRNNVDTQTPAVAADAAPAAAQTPAGEMELPAKNGAQQPAQAFTGQSGNVWNADQAQLLAAIPDESLRGAMNKYGKQHLTFDIIDLQNDPDTQQAWVDAGLTFSWPGSDQYVEWAAIQDEYIRRGLDQSMPVSESDTVQQQPSTPEMAATPWSGTPRELSPDATATVAWAKETYENGGMTQEAYEGIVEMARQYSSSAAAPAAPTATPTATSDAQEDRIATAATEPRNDTAETVSAPMMEHQTEDVSESDTMETEKRGINAQLRANAAALNAMEPVANITVPVDFWQWSKDEKQNWIIEKLRPTGYAVDRKGVGTIQFPPKRLRKAFNYFRIGESSEAAFEALPAVFSKGIEIDGHSNHKGREYKTVTLAAPVVVNGARGNLAAVVMKTSGNFYKVHRLLAPDGTMFMFQEKEIEAESTPGGGVTENGSLATPINSASADRISREIDDVKSGDLSRSDTSSTVGVATQTTNTEDGGIENVSTEEGDLSGGNIRGNVGSRAAGQTRSMASRTEGRSAPVNQARAAIQRQNSAKDIRKISSKEIGIQSGTDTENLKVLPVGLWDADLQTIADRVRQKTGKEVVFVLGTIEVRGKNNKISNIRGVINETEVVIQADHTRITAEQIADHEIYHDYAHHDRSLNRQLRRHIQEQYSAEVFNAILDKYIIGLSDLINIPADASTGAYEAVLDTVLEEIFADAYAGINAFGAHAEVFTEAVRAKMDQLGYGETSAQSNGTRQTAGPPEDYFIPNKNADQWIDEKYSVNSDFYKQLDNWDGKTIGFSFVVGETSQALQEAGIPKKQIRWDASKIASLLGKHKGMTIEKVKQIPELLEHPVIVIDSKQNSNSRIIMGEVYDEVGNIVTGVLLLTPTSKKGNVLDYFKISSAEGRSHIKSLFTKNDGTPVAVRYVDKKRIQSWLNVNRLQLPLHNLDLDSVDMLPQEKEEVKGKSAEHFSVDDSDTVTDPDAATKELIEKLRSLSPSQMMGDDVQQVLDQYIKRTEPQPKPAKIEVDKGNLKKALSSTLGLNKEQKEQLKGILDEYTEQVKQPTKKRGTPKQTASVAESKPIKAKKLLRDKLTALFSIPEGERAKLGAYIDGFADRIVKDGRLTEDDRKAFFDHLYESGAMTVPADDSYREGRAYLLDSKIYVSDSVRQEFGDDWGAFRRRAWGSGIHLTNDRSDRSIDQWNVDLSEDVPGLFNSEETDMKSVLERIVQVAQEGKDEKVSLAEYTKMLAGEEYVSEAEVLDDMERKMDEALRSFAEAAEVEISLRDREGRRIAKERAERMEAAQLQKEKRELKELQKQTLKTLQWLSRNRNKAPEDLRAKWDEVLSDIDIFAVGAANAMNWSEKHNATWKDLAQIYKDAHAEDSNFLPIEEIEFIVDRLDNRKIADMDFDALQNLYKAAIGIREEFYNRHNVLNDEEHRLFAEVYKKSKAEIEAAAGESTGTWGDKFANIEMLSPMSVLQRMGGWNPDGTFFSMARQLENAERDQRAFTVKANRILEDIIKDNHEWIKKADGQGKDGIWYEYEVPQLKELHMGDKPVYGDTVKIYMTPAQKVHLYLESKNYDNLRHMVGGRTFANKELYSKGKRTDAFADGTTVKLAPETVKALVSDLTAEEQALADALTEYYNVFAKGEINRVSNILYGFDRAMGSFYAPIYTNQNYTNHEFGILDVTAEGVGNLKTRQFSKVPSYNISAFEAFEKSVHSTSRFVSMAIPERNWDTLLNWTESDFANSMRNVISSKWGADAIKYIDDIIPKLQAGTNEEYNTISTFADKLQSNYISSVFAFNPSIVMKQLGSVPLAAVYLDFKNWPSPKQVHRVDMGLVEKYTQELAWRTMGYATPELKHLKENPNWTQTNKVVKFFFGGGAITAMDGWAAKNLWPWAVNKVLRDFPGLEVGTLEQIDSGNSPFYKKVAEVFEYALNRSQSVSDEMHQGTLRKSKNLVAKSFTMFKSDSAQMYNTLRQKIGEAQYYSKHGTKEQKQTAIGAVAATVSAFVLGSIYVEAISLLNALWKNKAKYYRDDEEELTAKSIWEEVLWNFAENTAGIFTGGDTMVQLLEGVFSDGAWFGSIEAPGLEQINHLIEEAQKAGSGIYKLVAGSWDVLDNGGDLGAYWKRHAPEIIGGVKDVAGTVASYLYGIPIANVEAYLLGTVKWISPEVATAYEDALNTAEKGDLGDLTGKALEYRIGSILRNRNASDDSETAKVLAKLYSEEYTDVIPTDTPGSITVNGKDQKLSAYQQQQYDQAWADVVSDGLDELISSEEFKNADNATQAKMISNLYSYAKEIAKAELFDDHEMASGAVKYQGALDVGFSTSEYLYIKSIYDSIENDESLKASQKATKFSYWVDSQGFSDEQNSFIKGNLKYWVQTPAEASSYEKFSQNGLDDETALKLTEAIGQLEPEDGKTQVANQQKWQTVIQTLDDPEQQMAALSVMMGEAQYARCTVAYDNQISPDVWVVMQDVLPMCDEDGNGSYTQKEIKLAIDAVDGDLGSKIEAGWWGIEVTEEMSLSRKDKAVLWQLLTGASPENNPYDVKTGKKIQKEYDALRESQKEEK